LIYTGYFIKDFLHRDFIKSLVYAVLRYIHGLIMTDFAVLTLQDVSS